MDRRRFLLAALACLSAGATADEARAQARRAERAAPARRRVVALDAGHGGKDPGAIGMRGTHEKDVTLAVTRLLARRLEASGRYAPVLIRGEDQFVVLERRVAQARARQAELFVSLHADSIPNNRQARGFSVYTLSETASDALAGALATRENDVDRLAGLDLSRHSRQVRNILLDLMHRETANNSQLMAHRTVDVLAPAIPPLPHPHRQANFAVLRAPDIPSVLIEMGFLSNPEDERALTLPAYQGKLAERLGLAIDQFFRAV